jgi:hypothetical protein
MLAAARVAALPVCDQVAASAARFCTSHRQQCPHAGFPGYQDRRGGGGDGGGGGRRNNFGAGGGYQDAARSGSGFEDRGGGGSGGGYQDRRGGGGGFEDRGGGGFGARDIRNEESDYRPVNER